MMFLNKTSCAFLIFFGEFVIYYIIKTNLVLIFNYQKRRKRLRKFLNPLDIKGIYFYLN
jgi:hypothetical protein